MNSEQIIKIGKLVYAKIFDDFGNIYNSDILSFRDKHGDFDCKQIFWRFYWIED